jgi:hypothetical protein
MKGLGRGSEMRVFDQWEKGDAGAFLDLNGHLGDSMLPHQVQGTPSSHTVFVESDFLGLAGRKIFEHRASKSPLSVDVDPGFEGGASM